MPDVMMFHGADGGEVTIEGGQILLRDGPETAVYLSLFGGDERDRGTPDTISKTWWGNRGESDAERRYRSETAALLATAPITTSSARAIESAATRDLAWMTSGASAYAETVAAVVTLPARNQIRLRVDVQIDGRATSMTFTETRV